MTELLYWLALDFTGLSKKVATEFIYLFFAFVHISSNLEQPVPIVLQYLLLLRGQESHMPPPITDILVKCVYELSVLIFPRKCAIE